MTTDNDNKSRLLVGVCLISAVLLLPTLALAEESEVSWPLEPMKPNLQDMPSLQNGFRLYVNYCIGCHAMQYQRYERTADDLEIPHDIALDKLVFTNQRIGEQMVSAIDTDAAKNWFGAAPPDLTNEARLRGPTWIYNYLKTFYLDPSRPFGVNNKVFPNVGMPDVMIGLQGVQREGCIQVPKIGRKRRRDAGPARAREDDHRAEVRGTGAGKKHRRLYTGAVRQGSLRPG